MDKKSEFGKINLDECFLICSLLFLPMQNPTKPEKEKMNGAVRVRLSQKTVAKLRSIAKARGESINVSDIIRESIEFYVNFITQ